jgi:type VI secretion system secreted protein Hcp
MAVKMFMQVDSIKGESADSKHKEWIDLIGMNHSVSQMVTQAQLASSKGTGVPVFSEINIEKAVDTSTPDLYLACANGDRIPKIVIEICQAAGEKELLATYTMENCLLTNVTLMSSNAASDDPMEEVGFGFSKINYKVKKGDRTWNVETQAKE